jgi:hypothetical protein
MRYYLVDEISLSDMEKLNTFLGQDAIRSELEQLFWIQIPNELLNDIQVMHRECQPYQFAIELGNEWLKAEFFIRSKNNLRCACSEYCTPPQRDFIIQYIQDILETLDIKT